MSRIPHNVNYQQRRNERKRTEKSLDKFTTNSNIEESTLLTESNCRDRINSVFRLKLRDLQEIRNKKKMSQSMIRSQKLDFQRKYSNEDPTHLHLHKRSFKEHFQENLEGLQQIED